MCVREREKRLSKVIPLSLRASKGHSRQTLTKMTILTWVDKDRHRARKVFYLCPDPKAKKERSQLQQTGQQVQKRRQL